MKAPVWQQFNDVGQRHTALDMPPHGLGNRPGKVWLLLQLHARQQMPGNTLGGATAGQLRRLGRSVDLVNRRSQAFLSPCGEFAAEWCRGRQAHIHSRHLQPRRQQCCQVMRRGYQHTRAWHPLQRIDDILRIKRLATPEAVASVQRQQEGGLETVAMLHRHRAHQRSAGAGQSQSLCLGAAIHHQPPPSLAMRLRQTR